MTNNNRPSTFEDVLADFLKAHESDDPLYRAVMKHVEEYKRKPFATFGPADTVCDQNRKRINVEQAERNPERVSIARAIADEIARRNFGIVATWMVADVFIERHGLAAFEDSNGKTYWAGSIFAGSTYVQVGQTKSPYNHNNSNCVWWNPEYASGLDASTALEFYNLALEERFAQAKAS